MAAEVYHFEFPSESSARLLVHLIVKQLREDVAVYRDGRCIIVIDGSGRDRRAELLEISVQME